VPQWKGNHYASLPDDGTAIPQSVALHVSLKMHNIVK